MDLPYPNIPFHQLTDEQLNLYALEAFPQSIEDYHQACEESGFYTLLPILSADQAAILQSPRPAPLTLTTCAYLLTRADCAHLWAGALNRLLYPTRWFEEASILEDARLTLHTLHTRARHALEHCVSHRLNKRTSKDPLKGARSRN